MSETPSTTRYELPEGGTTLLGYVVRRMHKTSLLDEAAGHVASGHPAEALLAIGLYAAAASTSYGEAPYQPEFNRLGDHVFEADPATGALVEARLVSTDPHFVIQHAVQLTGGHTFSGRETIEGTTIGWRGLGMPAPSLFEFATPGGEYTAHLAGTITSELVPGLLRPTRIRAYGELSLGDSAGHTGRLTFDRDGRAHVEIFHKDHSWERELDLAETLWPALSFRIEVQDERGETA